MNKIDCDLRIDKFTDSNIGLIRFTLEYERGDEGKLAQAVATNIGIECDGESTLISGLKIDLLHHDDLQMLRTFFRGLDLEKIISENA